MASSIIPSIIVSHMSYTSHKSIDECGIIVFFNCRAIKAIPGLCAEGAVFRDIQFLLLKNVLHFSTDSEIYKISPTLNDKLQVTEWKYSPFLPYNEDHYYYKFVSI